MKKGDYIRTENGIRIIEKYSRNKPFYNGHCIYFKDTPYCGVLYTDEEIKKMKSSTNIIDLIEVGDYVNGFYVISKPFNTRVHTEFDDFCEEDIKSIVTKEQFEEMEFKL